MTYTRNQANTSAECAEKRGRLLHFMQERQLDGVLISRHENIAWLTAGLVDIRVGLLRETGPAVLLVTRDGQGFYLTTQNEAARLSEEEFAGLDYTPVLRPWFDADLEGSIRSAVPKGRLATDTPLGEHTLVNLQPLRMLLTADEVHRYRWLGAQVAEVVTQVVTALEPGMSERTMQAMLAQQLLSRGLLPSVFLEATERRILTYPHPVPRQGVLERFAMIGLCARFAGLTVSMTRFVHFGSMPEQLTRDFSVVAHVHARVLDATRANATADELFATLREAYMEAGAPGGEQGHHQGGATGYVEREWLARPGGTEKVQSVQAFAWNPNLRGAKVEDTRLLLDDHFETVTRTPGLPEVSTTYRNTTCVSADVLVR